MKMAKKGINKVAGVKQCNLHSNVVARLEI
jgi:hypothetical protein